MILSELHPNCPYNLESGLKQSTWLNYLGSQVNTCVGLYAMFFASENKHSYHVILQSK